MVRKTGFEGGVRAILRVRVPELVYDWFFNGRIGYRAAYWVGEQHGIDANQHTARILTKRLRAPIRVTFEGIDRTTAMRSLEADGTKIWVYELHDWCGHFEHSIQGNDRTPRLVVPQWTQPKSVPLGCAPLPPEPFRIIEMKGEVVLGTGTKVTKDAWQRAEEIRQTGWT